VPGGDTQIYLWDEILPSGRSQAFYAVSGDSKNINGRVRATTYDVCLSDHSFDPLARLPVMGRTLSARPANSLFLVQFVSTPLPEFRFDIESLGGQIHRFLTDHTFLVEMSTETLKQVTALPYVRWTGPYHPEYRVENFLRKALIGATAKLDEQRYSIMVCSRDHDRQVDIDTVYYEVYLGETSPPSYFDTTPSYPATQTSITYDPGALNANTQYYWQIVAHDNRGKSTPGPIWSYSTGSAPLLFFAGMDIPVSNGAISGSYADTHASDDVYEGITERATNRSFLEHKWSIDVVGGYSAYTFSVEAYHTFNTEGDDFVFAYSTDDVNYMNIVTVTKTSDDDTAQTFSLPASISGTVYIKVLDLDRTKGNRIKDSIYVDQMFVEATP